MARTGNRPTPEVPGEESAADAAETGAQGAAGDEAEAEGEAAAPAAVKGKAAAEAAAPKGLPDADDVDPAKIPYGKTVLTNQGYVCSTQDPPVPPRR